MRACLTVLLGLLAWSPTLPTSAQSPPLTIEQVMADPDWIGPTVERPAWAWNGAAVQYDLKRADSAVRDTYEQSIDGSAARQVEPERRAALDGSNPVYDAARQRMVFVRNGDVFLRDLRSGSLAQLTRSNDEASQPRFATDGGVTWRVGNQWYRWNQATGASQAAVVNATRDPAAPPETNPLRDQQLRTLQTLARDRERREGAQREGEARRKADPTRAPAPVYLGDEVEIVDTALAPNGRWLLVVTRKKSAEAGQAGKMPRYITESGYEEFQEVRTRVGRNAPLAHGVWLVDVHAGSATAVPFDGLPGIAQDPLADLRKAAGKPALKGNREVRIETDGDGSGPAMHWNRDGTRVALLVRAIDNKDRWIATIDPATARLQPRHRLTDPGWINWNFNQFGWMPDQQTLWLLSEQDGHGHLYTQRGSEAPRQRTRGAWEVSAPSLSADAGAFLFVCNRQSPGRYEVCRLDLANDQVGEVTALDGGVEGFSLSPDGSRLLVTHSSSYVPGQLSVVELDGGAARPLTDTRSAAFRARQWIEPQIVQVPSRHGAGAVWGKYYGPATLEPGRKYPIVMFVHGAGYLQNVHARYPAYFREQMFHNLLVQEGYIVLDLDYRGSAGYGRDWRTAIYRNMGHPELEDYLDGLAWLVENRQGDVDRAGIYGGSYGGFMAFMALFREPGTFKAGAALRPVVDWTQYNHEYTSNILNTPELDPEAYRKSSPIEYAQGLQDHLLIAHGMVDDNVFYRDSVMLAQKLIELHKDDWELASYPLEGHGYTRADSWLDQYKRVYKLFQQTLK